MELSEVLNEIQEGLAPADNQLNVPDQSVAPEQAIQEVNIPSTSQDSSAHAADFQALENFKLCLVYRNALESMDLVSKHFAQEIFTMLPGIDDPVLAAKLTSAASAHNRSLLLNRLDKYQPSPESMLPMFSQIANALYDVRNKLETVRPLIIQVFQETQAQQLRTRSTAFVVYFRKSYSLYETPLSVLGSFDDRLLNYPPYEGKLQKAIFDVVTAPEYEEHTRGSKETTLSDVLRCIEMASYTFDSLQERLNTYEKKLANYEPTAFRQTDFTNLVKCIDEANQITKLYGGQNQLINAVIKLLQLLV